MLSINAVSSIVVDKPGQQGYLTAMAKETKCATPVITVTDGQVTFTCSTKDVAYKATISREQTAKEVDPNGTYTIRVYATKAGLEDSDEATRQVELVHWFDEGDINQDAQSQERISTRWWTSSYTDAISSLKGATGE